MMSMRSILEVRFVETKSCEAGTACLHKGATKVKGICHKQENENIESYRMLWSPEYKIPSTKINQPSALT